MRKALASRLLFVFSAVAAAGVWIACSGSNDQPITKDAGSDTSRPDVTVEPERDSGDEKDSGAADARPDVKIYDAGQPNVLDSGDVDGGIPCVVGGELEEEPNDDGGLANELKPTRCGVTLVNAVDAGESDFLKFELADASTEFFVQYAGNVQVLVETDGSAPVDITQGSPKVAFKKGQPYFVEVKSKDGKPQVWRVTLFQE
ncbi:MAG TPA: hypothetical protein VM925_23660 [Labilithrix sp.]|nr:hypothetical protein [Labilithrix sp.]